jgi:hypothetical protein
MALTLVAPMMHHHSGMLLSVPIMYGLIGFFVSVILCLAYNVIAKLVGGIELELSGSANSAGTQRT